MLGQGECDGNGAPPAKLDRSEHTPLFVGRVWKGVTRHRRRRCQTPLEQRASEIACVL